MVLFDLLWATRGLSRQRGAIGVATGVMRSFARVLGGGGLSMEREWIGTERLLIARGGGSGGGD